MLNTKITCVDKYYTVNVHTMQSYLLTHVFAISKIESRVTPGRIKPSSGGVAISGSMYTIR